MATAQIGPTGTLRRRGNRRLSAGELGVGANRRWTHLKTETAQPRKPDAHAQRVCTSPSRVWRQAPATPATAPVVADHIAVQHAAVRHGKADAIGIASAT